MLRPPRKPLALRADTIRVLSTTRLEQARGGQIGSSTGGDPRTCCWPDLPDLR